MIKKLICLTMIFIAVLSTNTLAGNKKPYYIEVNRATNIVSVYAPDGKGNYTNNVKNFICSTGTNTPDGTFKTSDKYEWRILIGNVYGQYATRIHGHILFHSVPYYTDEKNTLEYEEYNKLGTAASMGCIRLREYAIQNGFTTTAPPEQRLKYSTIKTQLWIHTKSPLK